MVLREEIRHLRLQVSGEKRAAGCGAGVQLPNAAFMTRKDKDKIKKCHSNIDK